LDVGRGEVFRLMKMGTTTPCGGWGRLKPKAVFEHWLKTACGAA
jgi:hypothetical protein